VVAVVVVVVVATDATAVVVVVAVAGDAIAIAAVVHASRHWEWVHAAARLVFLRGLHVVAILHPAPSVVEGVRPRQCAWIASWR